MSWNRKPIRLMQAERDTRMARLVMRQLRALGYAVTWIERREIGGARFTEAPAQLSSACGHVLVRPVGHRLTLAERSYMRSNRSFVQYGAHNIASLTAWIEAHSKPHWNA